MVILAEKKAKSEIDLRKLMDKMGLKANAFAEMCGISTQSLAQFMRPGKSLTTNSIYRIANALDIDPRDMFFPTEENEEGINKTKEENNRQENFPIIDDKKEELDAQPLQTTAFCPHCGAKVRVGVVLLPE